MNHSVWCSFRCLGVHICEQWPSANHLGAFHSVLLAVSEDSHWMKICQAVTDSSLFTVCLICAWSPLSEWQCVVFFCVDSNVWLSSHNSAKHRRLMSVKLLAYFFCALKCIDYSGGSKFLNWGGASEMQCVCYKGCSTFCHELFFHETHFLPRR